MNIKDKDSISIEDCYKSINGYSLRNDINFNGLSLDEDSFNLQSFSRNEYFYTPFERFLNKKLPSYLDNVDGVDDDKLPKLLSSTSTTTANVESSLSTNAASSAAKKKILPKKNSILEHKQQSQIESNNNKQSDNTSPASTFALQSNNIQIFKPNQVQKSKLKPSARTTILLDTSSLPNTIPTPSTSNLQQEHALNEVSPAAAVSNAKLSAATVLTALPIRKLPSIRSTKLNTLDISSLQKIAAQSSDNPEHQPPQQPQLQQQQSQLKTINQGISPSHLHQSIIKRPNIYHSIDDELEKLVNLIYTEKLKTVHSLPRYYKLIQSIDISTMMPHSTDPILVHRGTVLQLGKCPLFEKIPLNTEFPLSNYYHSNQEKHTPTYWTKSAVPTLSNDPNIQSLIEKNNIDIVLSSSSFVKLINNIAPFSEDWEIPITSRDYVNPLGENKRAFILDKPLLKKSLTSKEKNEKFFNLAVESVGLSRGEQSNFPPIHFSTVDDSIPENQYLKSTNITYNVWRFGEMKLLIRCKIHGLVPDQSSKMKVRYIGIKSKVEYQADRGFEDASASDTAKWWSYTFIRPDAHLILARVNLWNRKLIGLEKKEMTHILHPKCQFHPSKSSKITMELLKYIKNLSGGSRFLLVHKALENFVHVHQQTETNQLENPKDTIYDLHQSHQGLPVVNTDVPTVNLIPLPNPQPPTIKNLPQNNTNNNNNNNEIKICFSFAQNGQCKNPSNCNFSHLTMAQVKERNLEHQLNINASKKRKATKQKKKRDKKSKKQSNSDSDHDSGPGESMDSSSDLSYINSLLS